RIRIHLATVRHRTDTELSTHEQVPGFHGHPVNNYELTCFGQGSGNSGLCAGLNTMGDVVRTATSPSFLCLSNPSCLPSTPSGRARPSSRAGSRKKRQPGTRRAFLSLAPTAPLSRVGIKLQRPVARHHVSRFRHIGREVKRTELPFFRFGDRSRRSCR